MKGYKCLLVKFSHISRSAVLLLLSFAVSVLSCVFIFTSKSSAFSISSQGRNTISRVCVTLSNGTQTCQVGSNQSVDPGWTTSQDVWITGINIQFNSTFPANSIVTVVYTIQGVEASAGTFSGFTPDQYWGIVDQSYTRIGKNDNILSGSMQVYSNGSHSNITLDSGKALYLGAGSIIRFTAGNYVVASSPLNSSDLDSLKTQINNNFQSTYSIMYEIGSAVNSTSQAEQALLQEIRDKIAAQSNAAVVDAVNQAANQAHSDASAQLEATQKQTEQQKEQYEQEKQEESDREEQGNSDMSQATGIFNFNLSNPFSGLFGLFQSGGCVSVPIIASMVGSESTTYCSWFPASVRSILTPAFGIASMMLIFGFVVRWLGGSSSQAIDLGWDNTFYGKGGSGL